MSTTIAVSLADQTNIFRRRNGSTLGDLLADARAKFGASNLTFAIDSITHAATTLEPIGDYPFVGGKSGMTIRGDPTHLAGGLADGDTVQVVGDGKGGYQLLKVVPPVPGAPPRLPSLLSSPVNDYHGHTGLKLDLKPAIESVRVLVPEGETDGETGSLVLTVAASTTVQELKKEV